MVRAARTQLQLYTPGASATPYGEAALRAPLLFQDVNGSRDDESNGKDRHCRL
jgi:hypothetical protein